MDDVNEAILKSLKDLEEKRAQLQAQDTEDHLFSKQVAIVLKRLHPRQKAMEKLHMQQLTDTLFLLTWYHLPDLQYPDIFNYLINTAECLYKGRLKNLQKFRCI